MLDFSGLMFMDIWHLLGHIINKPVLWILLAHPPPSLPFPNSQVKQNLNTNFNYVQYDCNMHIHKWRHNGRAESGPALLWPSWLHTVLNFVFSILAFIYCVLNLGPGCWILDSQLVLGSKGSRVFNSIGFGVELKLYGRFCQIIHCTVTT
jgi:hypothetical protein